jgi:hypothetical protein
VIDPISLLGLVVLASVTFPLWARLVNEVAARTVGRVIVICPHCGQPGVVKSSHPQVFR